MLCSLLGHFGLLRSRSANGGGSEKDLLGIMAVNKRGVPSDQGAQVTRRGGRKEDWVRVALSDQLNRELQLRDKSSVYRIARPWFPVGLSLWPGPASAQALEDQEGAAAGGSQWLRCTGGLSGRHRPMAATCFSLFI